MFAPSSGLAATFSLKGEKGKIHAFMLTIYVRSSWNTKHGGVQSGTAP